MDKSRQQNDLEKLLVKKIDQVKPYSGHIFWGCIAVIAVIIIVQFWSYNSRLVQEREWDTYIQATTLTEKPEDLEPFCDEMKSGIVAANLRITAGERYLDRAGTELAREKENALKDVNTAIGHFEEALKISSETKVAEAASYGLARSYELLAAANGDKADMEKAISQYKKMQSSWPKGPYASAAGEQLAFLERDGALNFFTEFSENRDVAERLRKESLLNLDEGKIGELTPGGGDDFMRGFEDMFKDEQPQQPEINDPTLKDDENDGGDAKSEEPKVEETQGEGADE